MGCSSKCLLEYTDDSKWLEACDELIQQFSNGGQKKRGRKKKVVKVTTTEDDPPAPALLPPPSPVPQSIPPALSSSKISTDSSSDSDDDKPLRPSKIKKESNYDSDSSNIVTAKPTLQPCLQIKKEQKEEEDEEKEDDDKQESEEDEQEDDDEDVEEEEEEEEEEEDESEQSSDSDSSYEAKTSKYSRTAKRGDRLNGRVELRGQRSNTSTTRIRIQNSLEDSSAAESSDTDDSYKAPIKKTPLRKAKVIMKKKKLPKSKTVTRKKGKNIDPKREKVRHMMLRRMETRKSRLDASKSSKSTGKTRNDSTTSEEQQPIMTRKMTRQECQKEKSRIEELRNKKPSPGKKDADDKSKPKSDSSKNEKSSKTKDDKCKKDNKPDDKSKSKVEDKSKPKKEEGKVKPKDKNSDESQNQKVTPTKQNEDTKPTRSSVKDASTKQLNKSSNESKSSPVSVTKKDTEKNTKQSDKSKKSPVIKSEPKDQPVEDVTRRSLRSRNIVVDEKNSQTKKSSKKSAPADLAKSKSPIKSKNDERKKPPPAPPPIQLKPEKPPTWEEELFNYKYSLRMPVKLINIAKPPNWPKNNGGASSLPDLDRSESDSDLLNDCPKQTKTTPKKRNKDESKVSNTKEFKDSVKFLKEKFDKKIEEHKASTLTQLMIDNKMKIIPKSSDGPELLPTPSLDSLKSKLNNKSDSPKKNSKKFKESAKTDNNDEKKEIVEDSLIGYFRKETVDVFKEVFEKHQVANQFKTVILESRTRTQTKEMKHNATLKQVFGCDRPASAPPVSDSTIVDDDTNILQDKKVKNSTNGCLKGLHKSFAKFKLLMEEENRRSDEKSGCKDYEDSVDFAYGDTADADADAPVTAVVAVTKDNNNETEIENVVKRKSRSFRRKCRSSGFDYIRKKKKQKKEEDDEIDDKERKKAVAPMRPTPESIEDIQNEIRSWVVNKGIGETVLHKAARLGYSDISSYCLEKMNCSPSPTDNAGYTPLHEACTRGHLKIAKMLLKYGADVSASAKGGIRPLHEAVEHGNVELVRLLLAYGADPLLSTYAGQTPLSLVKDDESDLREFLTLYLADIQGSPSKPWPFLGYNNTDEEDCGYDPLTECPPPSPTDNLTSLEFEISDAPLSTLYRFKNDTELWMLCSDLPAKVRDSITKKSHPHQSQSDQNVTPASQYVTKKITRAEFEENVECASFLDYKFSPKTNKPKANYIMVKYNDKLLASLNIQKLTMPFS